MKTFNNYVIRTDIVKSLMKDVDSIKLISAEEERELFKKYLLTKDQNEKLKIRNRIIEGNLRLVISIAKTYDTNEKFTEIFNIGCLGMFEAFDKYDVNANVRFMTFASHYVRRAINSYYTFDDSMVRPSNCARILPKVKAIQTKFQQENERPAEATEIIDILKEKHGIDASYGDIIGARTEFIDDSLSESEDDYTIEDTSEYNAATASDNNYVSTMEQDYTSFNIEGAMKVLNKNQIKVVKMKFGMGYDREYQFEEIAEETGYTRERVRQLYNSALKKMRLAMVTRRS